MKRWQKNMDQSRAGHALSEMRHHQNLLDDAVRALIDRSWQLKQGKLLSLRKDKRLTNADLEAALERHVLSDLKVQDIKAAIGFERDWVQTWASIYLAESDAARHGIGH